MFIGIQSNDLRSALNTLVSGKKSIVNITVRDSTMYLQKVGSVIQDMSVPLTRPVEREVSITVGMTSIVKLIDSTKPIEVIIDETVFTMTQDGLNIPLTAMHEERIDIETLSSDLQGEMIVYSLRQLAKSLTTLEKFSKSLGVGESMIRFDGTSCVISYSNLIYKQDFMLHPLSLNANQIRELARCTTRESGSLKYRIDTNRSMMHFRTSDGRVIVIQITPMKSLNEFETFNKILDACKEVTRIDFNIKDRLDLLLKSIPKSHLEVVVAEREFSVTSTGIQTIRIGTNNSKYLFNIRLSSVQLELLCNLMEGQLGVMKGDNKVVWKTVDKILMMSGLSF